MRGAKGCWRRCSAPSTFIWSDEWQQLPTRRMIDCVCTWCRVVPIYAVWSSLSCGYFRTLIPQCHIGSIPIYFKHIILRKCNWVICFPIKTRSTIEIQLLCFSVQIYMIWRGKNYEVMRKKIIFFTNRTDISV